MKEYKILRNTVFTGSNIYCSEFINLVITGVADDRDIIQFASSVAYIEGLADELLLLSQGALLYGRKNCVRNEKEIERLKNAEAIVRNIAEGGNKYLAFKKKELKNIMNKDSKIIHVELKEPFLAKKNYYFGSVSAIFQKIPESVIGVKAITVQRNLHNSEEYQAPGATIRKGVLTRKSQRRKKL